MNGKLYVVGDLYLFEGKNEIFVYNGKKDFWEIIKGVLEDFVFVLVWGLEFVSFGGKFCIVGIGL